MTQVVLNRAQVREVDRLAVAEYGLASLVLMENAGRGVADVLCRQPLPGPVVICCGKGNNAGDGFVVARHLELRGHDVRTLLFADPGELRGDAATNCEVLRRSGAAVAAWGSEFDATSLDEELRGAAWLVDALLGTGATGEPRPPLDAAIDAMNAAGTPILAVDLPSGLDGDTGAAATHTIHAHTTCTFVALKPGFLVTGAERYTGRVEVLDIGVPRCVIERVRQTSSP